MSADEEILERAIVGIPRVAERIVELPHEQRQKAFDAAEQSYLKAVIQADCTEEDAPHWVGLVMDTLRAEVAIKLGLPLDTTALPS